MDKLAAEKEGFFLWCLEGLQRLIANDYRFTGSNRDSGCCSARVSLNIEETVGNFMINQEILEHGVVNLKKR